MGKDEQMKEKRRAERKEEEQMRRKKRAMISKYTALLVIVLSILFCTWYIMHGGAKTISRQQKRIESAFNEPEKKKEEPIQKVETELRDIEVKKDLITNATARISTEKGDFVVDLLEDAAPKTVTNFVELAESGFYNDTTFHRVVPGFVIQGGDTLSKDEIAANDGTGDPGYRFANEINPEPLELSDEIRQQLIGEGFTFNDSLPSEKNAVGTLSMANAGPATNGSQFFVITDEDQPGLNGKHTVFGKVLEGMDVAKTIAKGDKMTITIERE